MAYLFALIGPLGLCLVYLTLGADSFLLSWVDVVLVVLIQHWLSNVTPLILIVNIVFALWGWLEDWSTGFKVMSSLMIVQ